MKIDELIERLENMAFDFKWENGIGDKYVELANEAAEAIRVLNAVPAADVVEVVRCKDCKHNRGVTTDLFGNDAIECDVLGEYNPLDWFCAAGERENNDDKLL